MRHAYRPTITSLVYQNSLRCEYHFFRNMFVNKKNKDKCLNNMLTTLLVHEIHCGKLVYLYSVRENKWATRPQTILRLRRMVWGLVACLLTHWIL